ncbi:peptide chain release factor 3 [Acidocella aquatica]|uniref:Peptide chain release factor 3 n=1 Tax=Acidocella aquatica TaxID=1922313 RepID=A0ABQ6A8K2_9PROT|nr:peptide chain release factor 3 [Acidocella aquatica]GLR68496.1 peptide chain release factor 3 [Acidocella aquatica]
MDQALPISETGAKIPPRRTFAIISHPDAGKTTLTEKLLLFGGAIREAGMVKARQDRRQTRSDWMKIERQRGISVTSSVMTFEFGGAVFNLLDTPGHEDFSEDTYRTLTAVDSAVMVIDAAKGIELQTKKLFEVCRLRNIPITTFINKVDREGQNPFELLDEIANTLALDITPMVWPIGTGGLFRGCYDLRSNRLVSAVKPGQDPAGVKFDIPANQQAQLEEDVELIRAAYPEFDQQAFSEGHLTPVYFGSALKDYSVRELLEGLVANAPAPQPRAADTRVVEPTEIPVTGFVFKVQANMDPQHRDRIAFTRICSGKFVRGMKLIHSRTLKPMAIQAPIFFFAQDRSLAEEAYPGDIIGIPNHGTLRVGDTLTEGEKLRFTGIPDFAPEILRRVRLADPMKAKQMRKALEDLAEEGVTQVFRPMTGAEWIVGVVGALQLDVLSSRIEQEYSVPVAFEAAPYDTARWIFSEDQARLKTFIEQNKSAMSEDREGAPVYLVRNSWELNRMKDNFPEITFSATRERR